jgi:hypothetical protein
MLEETTDVEMNENITDETVEDNVNPEITFELGSEMINEIICELRCKTSLTHAMISVVVNMMIKISLIISSYLKSQVKCFLRCFSIDLNCPQAVKLLNLFDVSAFFKNTDTFRKQLKFNLKHIHYVLPEEIILGYRTDTVIKNNESIRKDVKESYQYLSIKSTLISHREKFLL